MEGTEKYNDIGDPCRHVYIFWRSVWTTAPCAPGPYAAAAGPEQLPVGEGMLRAPRGSCEHFIEQIPAQRKH